MGKNSIQFNLYIINQGDTSGTGKKWFWIQRILFCSLQDFLKPEPFFGCSGAAPLVKQVMQIFTFEQQ